MITKQNFKDGVDIIYYEDSTKVTNSYLLDDDDIERVASEIAYSRSCKFDWRCIYLRDEKSYIREIKAHNKLYKMNYKVDHTRDTDLEEKIPLWKELAYWLIGR